MTSALQWANLIRTDGLAVTIVLFLMVVFVIVLRWIGTNVARPVTASSVAALNEHVNYLKESVIATKAIIAGVDLVKTDVRLVRAKLETQNEILDSSRDKICDLHDLLIVRRQGVTQQQVSAVDETHVTP